jgi:hypothetical protein
MSGPVTTRALPSAIAWVALAVVGCLALEWGSYLVKLLATALCLALVAVALPRLARAYPFARGTKVLLGRTVDLEDLARRAIPPALLAALASALLWPLVLGQMPRSQDHTVHVARAWIFVHELLGRGRLSGWSSAWFAGYPAGQDYPPGTDLWICFFRALHLGLPDWSFTYAQAYLAFTIAGALAMYWLALRASGGSRLTGVVSGAIWLLDPGAYREGGWSFTVYWGVWAQVLGQAFAALAVAALDRLLDRPSARWAAAVALLAGFAILCHPMSLVALAVLAPCALAARWIVLGKGGWPAHGLGLAAGALGWGGAVSAWWLLPFLSRSAWTIKVPELWRSMDSAADGLVRGAPFQAQWPLLGLLALVGLVRAVRERRHLMIGLALSTAVLLFVSTSTAFEELRLEDLSASFGRLIYQRLSMPAKVGWFALAAFGAAALVERLRGEPGAGQGASRARAFGLAALGALAAAPFVFHGAPIVAREFFDGVGEIRTAASEPDYRDYRRFLDWSRDRWEERNGFYRIAYLQPRNEHFMADAIAYNHTPAYKVGWTPATTFRIRPESDDPEVLRALSVRYVVSRTPVPGDHLVPVRSFGNVHVYRLVGERPERFHLTGAGHAEALRFDEELVRIRVAGADATTRLTIHAANYADWRASIDGHAIARIETAPIAGERYPAFMRVAVPRDGVVELRFLRPPLRVLSEVASLLALLGVVLAFVSRRLPAVARVGRSLRAPAAVVARAVPWVLLVLAALGVAVAAGRWVAQPSRAPGPFVFELGDHLATARARIRAPGGDVECARGAGRLLCGGLWVGSKQVKVGIVERPCIWAPPPDAGTLEIVFPEVPLGSSLAGRHGLSDFAATQTPEGTAVKLRVAVERGPSARFVAPNEVGWRPWRLDTAPLSGQRRDVTFEVSSESSSRRHYCFEGGVAAGR